MLQADAQMWDNGIVAVADIANTIDSKAVKEKSQIYYHTFVELLCFEPDKAKDIFREGTELIKVIFAFTCFYCTSCTLFGL